MHAESAVVPLPDAIVGELAVRTTSTRAELADALAAPIATVSRVVARLIDDDVVEVSDERRSSGGRPVQQIALRADTVVAVAVDVAATATTTATVDLRGRVTNATTVPAGERGADRLASVLAGVRDAVRRATAEGVPCVGVGVSVAGRVAQDGVVTDAPTIGWHGVDLARPIQDAVSLPVVVESDVNVLSVAESRWGAGRDAHVVVTLALSWDIAAGIAIDGEVFRGGSGRAGFISRMPVGTADFRSAGGERADLASRLGLDALAARAGGVPGSTAMERVDALIRAAHDGETEASALLDRVVDELAVAVAGLVSVLDPEVIVLSGALGDHRDVIAPALRARLAGRFDRLPQLTGPTLGDQSWLSSAGRLAIDANGPLLGTIRAARSNPRPADLRAAASAALR